MKLSDNLKKIRKEHNLSQEQLAEKLGVSRQSVSKWESGQAYPEMDKMIQICQMFNLSVDELLNENYKEVNNNKQSKNSINKFIDDFLDYITKTIDMFSSMKFKGKVKCIFEQLILALIFFIAIVFVGLIGKEIFRSVFSFLPSRIYYYLFNIFGGIYFAIALFSIIILMLYIFKVRYLDYYVIVKEEIKEDTNDIEKSDDKKDLKNKMFLEKKTEKLIIRDPKHSDYRFISILLKGLLFCIKVFTCFIAIIFCFSLVMFSTCLVLSFMFCRSGFLFIGILIVLISAIAINLIILLILYGFIMSKKNNKNILALVFAISIILFGFGVGLVLLSFNNFTLISLDNEKYFSSKEYSLDMEDKMYFYNSCNDIDYIESDNNNIKVVLKYSKYYNQFYFDKEHFGYYFYPSSSGNNFEFIKEQIENINNNKLVDYQACEIKIYTTKENIDKLKYNYSNRYN